MSDITTSQGSRIAQMIKELGLNPNSFAAKLRENVKGYKIAHPSILRFIKDEYSPRVDFYDAVENVFGYSRDWLRTGKGDPKQVSNVEIMGEVNVAYGKTLMAPVYGHVYCGAPVAQWRDDDVKKYLSIEGYDKSTFGLIARGDSMEPYINPNDILICVDNPILLKEKTAVIVVFKSEPETLEANAKLFKRNKKRKEIMLYSINTKYPPETYHESEILKIYKVVEIRRKVK